MHHHTMKMKSLAFKNSLSYSLCTFVLPIICFRTYGLTTAPGKFFFWCVCVYVWGGGSQKPCGQAYLGCFKITYSETCKSVIRSTWHFHQVDCWCSTVAKRLGCRSRLPWFESCLHHEFLALGKPFLLKKEFLLSCNTWAILLTCLGNHTGK